MKQPSFDLVAPFYDQLAKIVFGNSLAKSQVHFLHHIPARARILLLGGGTGWILEEIISRCEDVTIDYVEASGKMLKIAQSKYKKLVKRHRSAVNFILGDENSLGPEQQYQTVITFFVLDIQPDNAHLCQMMRKIDMHLQKGGIWLFADFCNKQKWWQAIMTKVMFYFFQITCGLPHSQLPSFNDSFRQLKLVRTKQTFFYRKFIQSAVYIKTED